MAKNKDERSRGFRDRRGEILFIDARNLYEPAKIRDKKGRLRPSRRLNVLTDKHIQQIANTYRAWRKGEGYKDIPGFCKSATLEEIRKNRYILTPGRYVGLPKEEEDTEPFEEKMRRLTKQLARQFAKAVELRERIKKNLGELGYEF